MTNSNEASWIDIVRNLGLQRNHIIYVQKLIKPEVKSLCTSIVLTGSRVVGEARSSSNLDFEFPSPHYF